MNKPTKPKAANSANRQSDDMPLYWATGAQAVGIANMSIEGHFLRSNKAFCDFLGYTQEELKKKTFIEVTYPEDLPGELELHEEAVKRKRTWYALDKRYVHKDGSVVWAHVISTILPQTQGGGFYFMCIVEDIEQRRKDMLLSEKKDEALRTLISKVDSYAIFHINKEGIIVSWNTGVEYNLGYTEDEFVGRPFHMLFTPEDRKKQLPQKELTAAKKKGRVANARFHVRKDGSRLYTAGTTNVVRDADGSLLGYTIVLYDNTLQKQVNDALQYELSHDPLTRLANRETLEQRLLLALSMAKRNKYLVAVLYIDIDNFKQVNDRYGHLIGDSVLREVANRLSEVTREEDTVARLGGDEFVIMLPRIQSAAQAELVAKKILESMHEAIHVKEQVIPITLSIGISIYPLDKTNVYSLLQNADMAMYKAKRLGGNSIAQRLLEDVPKRPLVKRTAQKRSSKTIAKW